MGLRSLAADLLPAALQAGERARAAAPTPEEPVASFAALSRHLGYLSKPDVQKVREAFKFADGAHLGQFRASGEPYITHPLAVAGLCAGWKLDAHAIMAALMHDAMEDCGVTKVELIERFGAPAAELVDGLTKLDRLQFSSREESQAESFRKMLLAMTRDVRVILVKLADRLHNMRTMEAMAAAKRSRIARETLEIYAPIAHRLGLNQVYRELQELSFAHVNPWRHRALAKAVQRSRGYRRDIVERVQRDVEAAFSQARAKVSISGREKTVFSIYRKMREKHASFAQVNDLFGFRVVVPTLNECYLALGILHQLYKPVPGRFKDYIAIPKANGYRSLHTTLVSPLGTAVEFQIRTEEMHAVAESGIAAHWMYKGRDLSADDAQRLGAMWLRSLIDIQDETRDPAEFLEHVKIDLTPDAVYVFTPKSRILALPRGATPVDFAYAIHSDVGDRCVAASVNGEPVALHTELSSGDVVAIVTAPHAQPHPSWLNFVRTGRARSKIRHFLKTLEVEESCALGAKLLGQALRAEGYALPTAIEAEESPPDAGAAETAGNTAPEKTAGDLQTEHWAAAWQATLRWSGNRLREDLLSDIGQGRKIASIVAKRMAGALAERGLRPDAITLSLSRYGDAAPRQSVVTIDGSEGASVRFAACCRPIPGDEVAGYLGRGEGLTVHTRECPVGRRLKLRDGEHWMPVEWAEERSRLFETAVTILVRNGKGVLAQVAQAISSAEADITHIAMGDERARETTELTLILEVRDRQHLAEVIRRTRRSPPVLKVARTRG